MKPLLLLIGLVLLTGLEISAWAYPENIRHGYQNCVTCHVSPSGGGITTEYGRELSKEIMSTWSRDGEQKPLYGLVNPPSWLLLGGDYRSLFLYQNTPTVSSGKSIFMQGDLEVAATYQKLTLVGTLGYHEPSKKNYNPDLGDYLAWRRHYLLYKIDDAWSVRAGKFDRTFGIKIPDHIVATKRGLEFDQDTETYNVEASYITDKFNLYLTAILGGPDKDKVPRESGIAASLGYALTDTYKVGLSEYAASSDLQKRQIFGPWAILGFTPSLFLLSELDIQNKVTQSTGLGTWGLVNYDKLGWEVYQGVIPYLAMEQQKLDFAKKVGYGASYGVGAQFFPRPHFDFVVQYQKQHLELPAGSEDDDVAYAMFHFYL